MNWVQLKANMKCSVPNGHKGLLRNCNITEKKKTLRSDAQKKILINKLSSYRQNMNNEIFSTLDKNVYTWKWATVHNMTILR